MKRKYREYNPEQPYLLPPSLQDWLPGDHLSYFISDTVEQLDLSNFKVTYNNQGGEGTLPYSPCMLVKVILYGYATGTFSSRKIKQKLHEDIAFRMLGAGNFPSYRTIARFRKENLASFGYLFTQVVMIAQEAGLVKLGVVAIDGSKVHANASKHKAMSYDRMLEDEKRIKAEIDELLNRAQAVDEAEAEEDDTNIPEELSRRESRLAVIKSAKKRLEDRIPEDKRQGKSQENFTDPDSRIMKTGKSFEQCYNVQVSVDAEAQIIVAAEVTQEVNDKQQMEPMVDAVKRETGELPDEVLADCGYGSEKNRQVLEDRKVRGYVPEGREGKPDKSANIKKSATSRMARRLKGKRGKKKYSLRKGIVEPVFGWAKGVLGFRQFSLRGFISVQGEWKLVCLALNLRRLSRKVEWNTA